MPFPVDPSYVQAVETACQASLPEAYRSMMQQENGGRVQLARVQWWLHPVFDTSDKKRIKRTCNHVMLETKNRLEDERFPPNGLEIAADGWGNALVLVSSDGAFGEDVHVYDHETGALRKTKFTVVDVYQKRESQ